MTDRSLAGPNDGSRGGLVDDLVRITSAGARNWRLVLLVIAISLTAATVYLARRITVYQATARILILQKSRNPLARPQDAIGEAGEAMADSMPTQALLIRSPLIVGRALEVEGIKGLASGSVLGGLAVSRPDPTAKILQVAYTTADADLAKSVVSGILKSYREFLDEHYHEKNGDAAKLLVKARDELNEELKALERDYLELHRGSTGATEGDSQSSQARRLAQWDQAAGEARLRAIQLREQLRLGRSLADQGGDLWAIVHAMSRVGVGPSPSVQDFGDGGRSALAGELADLELRRKAAERSIERWAAGQSGAAELDESAEQELARRIEADPSHVKMQADLDAARARLEDIRRRARKPGEASIRHASNHVDALEEGRIKLIERLRPAVLQDLTTQGAAADSPARLKEEVATLRAREDALRERLAAMDEELLQKLRRSEVELAARGPEDAPDLVAIRKRIARLDRTDDATSPESNAIQDLLDATETSLQSVESMQAELQSQFAKGLEESKRTETHRLALDNARSNLDRQRQLYNTVVDQLKHVHLSDDFRGVSAQIIDPPVVSAVRPNSILVLAVAGLFGLALGLGIVGVVDRLDPRLRSLDDIRSIVDLPMLGVIPRMPSSLPVPASDLGLIGHFLPRSPIAEVLRMVRTNLEHRRRGEAPKVILVTSPAPGDGKTVTASNLAICLAEAGRRVLLIDADMRRPRFDAIYEMPPGPGLSHALEGAASLPDVARPTAIARLSVVTAGEETPSPAELLASPAFRSLLDEARASYDLVVVDSPPLLVVADAGIIGGEVDGIILVVRGSTLRRQEAERAMEALEAIGTPTLGLVVNRPEGTIGTGAYGAYINYGTYGRTPPSGTGRIAIVRNDTPAPDVASPARKSG